jgi:phospholipid/cholesterol/gamma-HCH transport system substrate-binding protein
VIVSSSLSRLHAVILGAVVLTGLVLGVFGLFVIGGKNALGSGAFEVSAGFPDIAGVEVGTRVRIQGIDAGEVVAVVTPEAPGGNVLLRMRLAGRVHHLVGADARVQIVSEGLLAGKVVKIIPGSPGAGPVPDQTVLTAQPTPELTEGLAQATERLNRVLGQADETLQGVRRGEGTLGQLVTDKGLYDDLTTTLRQVRAGLEEIRKGEGTLGQLVKNNELYAETLRAMQHVPGMIAAVKQDADAIKALPVIRSYVQDPHKELNRPDCMRHRRWLPEDKLFEPGRAVLTAAGRRQLDELAPWVNGIKPKGSEVVVATFAGRGANPDFAQTLTQKQSEAVCDYLTGYHKVHKTGWWWFSKRSVKPIGCGTSPSPVPEKEPLPAPRIEVLVFVPQG